MSNEPSNGRFVSAMLGALTRRVEAYTADCPDTECVAKLVWTDKNATLVYCHLCGQRLELSSLHSIESTEVTPFEITNDSVADIPTECVEIDGFSNFECQLIAPFLTTYGIDRDGQPHLIRDLNASKKRRVATDPQNLPSQTPSETIQEIFDVSVLSDRSFRIEKYRLNQPGYGIDRQAATYLADTLNLIRQVNAPFHGDANAPCLVPLATSGDGNCLAHAISRALVGRELFTHALLTGVHRFIATNWDRLRLACDGFLTESDALTVLAECAPSRSYDEALSGASAQTNTAGLGPVHIFAFANLLRRPIVVLDSLVGVQSKAEYACVYLPTLHEVNECGTVKDGRLVLNGPVVIAWANAARNHFVPLVGLIDRPATRFPAALLLKAFCAPASLINRYFDFDDHQTSGRVCLINTERQLTTAYLTKLVRGMREQFRTQHGFGTDFVSALYRISIWPSLSNLVHALLRGSQLITISIERARQLHRAFEAARSDSTGELSEQCELYKQVVSTVERRRELRDESVALREAQKKVLATRRALQQRLQQLLLPSSGGLLGDSPFVPDSFTRNLLELERSLNPRSGEDKDRSRAEFDAQVASKSIATGWSQRTFHKEELNESNSAEREVARRVRENAAEKQQRTHLPVTSTSTSTSTSMTKRKNESETREVNEDRQTKSSRSSIIRLRVVNTASNGESHVLCVTPMTTYAEFVTLVESQFGKRLDKLWYAVGVQSQPKLIDVSRREASGTTIDFEMTPIAFTSGERINAEFLGPLERLHSETVSPKNCERSDRGGGGGGDGSRVLQEAETVVSIWCHFLGEQEPELALAAPNLALRNVVYGLLKVCANQNSKVLKRGGCVYMALRKRADDAVGTEIDPDAEPVCGVDYHCETLFPGIVFRYDVSVNAFRIDRIDADAEVDANDADSKGTAEATAAVEPEIADGADQSTETRVINDFYLDDDDDTELEHIAAARQSN